MELKKIYLKWSAYKSIIVIILVYMIEKMVHLVTCK